MTKRMKHPAERPGVLFQLTNTDPPYWWCNFCCGPHADVLKRVNVEHATLFGEIESFAGVARGDSQIVVDVGANIGQFCLLAASRGHRVLAFEPVSINLNHLKSSLAANEFRHPVELYEAAVGDRDGTADLFVPADFGASDQARALPACAHVSPSRLLALFGCVRAECVYCAACGAMLVSSDVMCAVHSRMNWFCGLCDVTTGKLRLQERVAPGAAERNRACAAALGRAQGSECLWLPAQTCRSFSRCLRLSLNR